MKNRFLIVFVGILFLQGSKAQTSGFELGAWFGGMNYFGDLNQNYDLTHPGITGGIQGRYIVNKRISLSLRGAFGQIRGNDLWMDNPMAQARGLNFTSWLWDITPQIEFNFLPFEHGSRNDHITPYVGIGASVFRFNPKGTYAIPTTTGVEEMTFDLRDLNTEGQLSSTNEVYSRVGVGLNVTLGLRWYVGNNWTLQVFGTARRTNSDYIDDVSTNYSLNALSNQYDPSSGAFYPAAYAVDPQFVMSGRPIGSYGSRDGLARGDDDTMDTYSTFGIGMTYFFGICRCPKINK